MTNSEVPPVLIAGAGPSGLVAALGLAQSGIKVRIIDRADSYRIGARGFGLQPRTFETFRLLGIQKQVEEHAMGIPTLQAYKLPGGTEPVKQWDLYPRRQPWPDRPYPNGLCLHQSILEEIIRDKLAEYGISVELSKALTAIEQKEGDDVVIATVTTCKNGELTEESENVSARYIIGADGAKGTSRKLMGLTFQGETRDADGQVWADVEIDGLSNEFWHVWAQPERFSVMMRPTTKTGNIFHIAIVGQSFDPVEQASPEKAMEFIQKETGRTDLRFGKWSWINYYKPNMRIVNKFQNGRVFIVGDAAHVHSPTGGQGINCSVQDASNLSWKLALVLKSHAPPSLLDTYNEERLPVITQMLYATTKLYTHLVSKEKEQTNEADAVKSVPAIANDRSQFMKWRNDALELYGVNYRFSSIVLEERANTEEWDAEDVRAHAYSGYEGRDTLCAGDRAPDAPALYDIHKKETTCLLDVFRTDMHTVLIFANTLAAASVSAILDAIRTRPAGLIQILVICDPIGGGDDVNKLNVDFTASSDIRIVQDKENHAATSYRILNKETVTIVIVRPDSFIGAIVSNAEGVRKYFAKIFVQQI